MIRRLCARRRPAPAPMIRLLLPTSCTAPTPAPLPLLPPGLAPPRPVLDASRPGPDELAVGFLLRALDVHPGGRP